MMVAHASGENPPDDGLPEVLVFCSRSHIASDDPPLWTKKCFMGGTCNNIRTFFKGLLKIGPNQSQYMGHVIMDDRLGFYPGCDLNNLLERLLIKDHALAQDNQLRFMYFQERPCCWEIDLIEIVLHHRERNNR